VFHFYAATAHWIHDGQLKRLCLFVRRFSGMFSLFAFSHDQSVEKQTAVNLSSLLKTQLAELKLDFNKVCGHTVVIYEICVACCMYFGWRSKHQTCDD
jgi:hypothetical protein